MCSDTTDLTGRRKVKCTAKCSDKFTAKGKNTCVKASRRHRTKSLLISKTSLFLSECLPDFHIPIGPAALPVLPTLDAVEALNDPLDIDNIQADILAGMLKKKELFFFFSIQDAARFKAKLVSDIVPLVTSTSEILSVDTQPITAVNIAFSNTGLVALSLDTNALGDSDFVAGQFSDAGQIGDDPSLWNPAFTGTNIHGVFLLASDTLVNIHDQLAKIQSALGSSVTEIHRLQAGARPGPEEGHEHFGFMDGISQPAVEGFTKLVLPGQTLGVFLLGERGDPFQNSHPSWAVDGSFLVFRQLQQLVPEFNKFLTDHPLGAGKLTPEQGSELLGARMVGRWKSGAPIFLAPTADDPVLGADRTRNNDFNFFIKFNQTRCPFSAHIRKTRPRGDLGPSEDTKNFIIRSSIPYGEEVTPAEADSHTTSVDRGLAFGKFSFFSYQTNINNGFVFLQQSWINNERSVLSLVPAQSS
ncbi:hypothetical protein B0H17DRAFT_961615 [Mycena rosella]|uniref:DyP dimeric alpha+beta barrel domain-containing protein n=1 Tax=Mycena rosella TaxID=1033263 RepID=A0AAD7FNG1_MYCRO|nr:hypothetical protein B0H17DRAFT_961615 [Mycena rosella]